MSGLEIFLPVYLLYSPRSEKREELENYCTEALAWCIIKSDLFAHSLLKEICMIARRKAGGSGLHWTIAS